MEQAEKVEPQKSLDTPTELEVLRRVIFKKQKTLNTLLIELAFLKEKLKTLSVGSD